MNLNDFIKSYDVDYTANLINEDTLKSAENTLNIKFGSQLKNYLLKYGYLGFKYIELFGINSCQELKSDMVTETLYLHKYFSKTADYIALANYGDGVYILVDCQDNVYRYISEEDRIIESKTKLFDFILNEFTEIIS